MKTICIMKLLKLLVFISILKSGNTSSLLEAVYWEIKPFIFTTVNGTLDGIIPQIFSKGQYHCPRSVNNSILLSFVQKQPSRKSFYNVLHSNTSHRLRQLSNVNPKKTFWAPVLSNVENEEKMYEKDWKLTSFMLMKSHGIAVILPRYKITLPNKIIRGILSCNQIFLIALLLSIIFAILLWLTERTHNSDYPRSIYRGIGTGIWWSWISMTTVGYGHVKPKSSVGRCIALVWLVIGLMVGCIMTATTTKIVNGVDDLSVYGKRVAVLENSFEAKIAAESYKVKVISATSYEEAIELVRKEQAFAAMINADVAAWYQDEIHSDNSSVPLRVVKVLPATLVISFLTTTQLSQSVKDALKCMHNQKDEIYTRSIEKFKRHCILQTLYTESFIDLASNNLIMRVLVVCIAALTLTGVSLQLHCANHM